MKIIISVIILLLCVKVSAQDTSDKYNKLQTYNVEIRKGNGLTYTDEVIIYNRSGLYFHYWSNKKNKLYDYYIDFPRVEGKEDIQMHINQLFAVAKDFERCMANDYFSPGAGISLYSIILRRGDEFKVLYVEPCLLSKFKELISLLISQLPTKHRKYLQNNFVRCFADQDEFDCFKKGEY